MMLRASKTDSSAAIRTISFDMTVDIGLLAISIPVATARLTISCSVTMPVDQQQGTDIFSGHSRRGYLHGLVIGNGDDLLVHDITDCE